MTPEELHVLFEQAELNEGISHEDFINLATREMVDLEDNLVKPAQETIKQIRCDIEIAVDRIGGRYEVPGFGSYITTGPSMTDGWDGKELDKLVSELLDTGDDLMIKLATRIHSCKLKRHRAGSVRFTRQRQD